MTQQVLVKNLDIEQLRKQLLRAIRGTKTQKEINDLLGYNFNQCAKWESGEKRILWTEFVSLLNILGLDVRPVFRAPIRYFGDLEDYPKLISYLSGAKKPAQIARDLEISRDKVGRWLNAKQIPTLEEMLQVILKYYSTMLVIIIETIVDLKDVPVIYGLYREAYLFKDFLIKNPWSFPLTIAMETREYQQLKEHQNGFLAEMIGINMEMEVSLISKLQEFGIVEKQNGKFKVLKPIINFTMKYKNTLPLRRFFLDKAVEYIEAYPDQPPGCFMLYDVLPIPQDNLRQVIDLCFEFYSQVKKIIETGNSPKQNIRVLNLNLFTLK